MPPSFSAFKSVTLSREIKYGWDTLTYENYNVIYSRNKSIIVAMYLLYIPILGGVSNLIHF